MNVFMSTTESDAERLLEQAQTLAKATGSLEIMDCIAILHGYLQLSKLDSTNSLYIKDIEHSLTSLQKAVECRVSVAYVV